MKADQRNRAIGSIHAIMMVVDGLNREIEPFADHLLLCTDPFIEGKLARQIIALRNAAQTMDRAAADILGQLIEEDEGRELYGMTAPDDVPTPDFDEGDC